MPGEMVSELLPPRMTEPLAERPVGAGAARPASGSLNAAAPVTGAGLRWALPLDWTLPTTRMLPADTWALPLAAMADDELESTATTPLTCRLAFPDTVRAPDAPLSRM